MVGRCGLQIMLNSNTEYVVADKNDKDEILVVLEDLANSSVLAKFGPDVTKMDEVLTTILDLPLSDAIVILAKEHELIVGVLIGTTGSITYNHAKVAMELAFWVDPQRKSPFILREFFKAFEYWANANQCDLIQCSSLQAPYGSKFRKYLKKIGYTKIEETYIKEL